MEDIKDTVVYWPSVRIIAKIDDRTPEEMLVPLDELKWNNDEVEPYLTLEEISNQLLEIGYGSPLYVWYELGLSGAIYLYGNYEPMTWERHGTTRGYA